MLVNRKNDMLAVTVRNGFERSPMVWPKKKSFRLLLFIHSDDPFYQRIQTKFKCLDLHDHISTLQYSTLKYSNRFSKVSFRSFCVYIAAHQHFDCRSGISTIFYLLRFVAIVLILFIMRLAKIPFKCILCVSERSIWRVFNNNSCAVLESLSHQHT